MDAEHPGQASRGHEEQLQALTRENLQLCEETERLLAKVSYLERRVEHLATSSAELSSRLVRSEEDKLKMAKELVEEKLEMSRMTEHLGEQMFELKNKILNQDSAVAQLEAERHKLLRDLQSTTARLKADDNRGLAEENAALRENYQALAEAHGKELAQSEELRAELLALAGAQDDLRRQVEEQQQSVVTSSRDLHCELDRVRDLIGRLSQDRVKPEDLATLAEEHRTMEKTLLGNQDQIKDTLAKMKSSYEDQRRELEERVVAMDDEQQEKQRALHKRQQEVTGKSAALTCSPSLVREVEAENSALQLRLKRLNEEFRTRLVCYIQDLAEYIDGLGEGRVAPQSSRLREFVDGMLQDVRSSYRVREEQLAAAVRSYKKSLQRVTETHQALLTAYRLQRELILANPASGLDPGPPETHFSLEPPEGAEAAVEDLQQLGRGEARLRAERVSCFVLSDRRLCLVCGGIPVSVPHPGFVSSSKSTRIMASKLVSRGKKVLQRARTNSHPVEGRLVTVGSLFSL
ncbi:coiled-coil domain-containing protein 78 [Nelusetta ayraudi]|uniref:coiled-coil domain-containing protein 78 n=1 Tax=Nelusetta ayraudi TaxID=303726 RepID=UPI003F704266